MSFGIDEHEWAFPRSPKCIITRWHIVGRLEVSVANGSAHGQITTRSSYLNLPHWVGSVLLHTVRKATFYYLDDIFIEDVHTMKLADGYFSLLDYPTVRLFDTITLFIKQRAVR
jgi:hypothetical protein